MMAGGLLALRACAYPDPQPIDVRAGGRIALLRDRADLLPLKPRDAIFVLRIQAQAQTAASDQFAQRLGAGQTATGVLDWRRGDPRLLATASSFPLLVVVLPPLELRGPGPAGLRALAGVHPRTVVVGCGGDPGVLDRFAGASTVLWCEGETWSPALGVALSRALLGRAPITGRLRIGAPGGADQQLGESRFGVLAAAAAEEEDAVLAREIHRLLRAKVLDRAFPGAVAMVTRRGRRLAEVAVGRHSYRPDAARVGLATRFDLASLTKVCATLPALVELVEAGVLGLDDPVARWLPEFAGPGKSRIRVRDLATHAAGLRAWLPFYKDHSGKAAVLKAAAAQPLAGPPLARYAYSDLGAILLMGVLERASQMDFEDLVVQRVFPRLGVRAVFARTGAPIQAAPTEDDPWRGHVVAGEAHDENAYAMGGVSGHAGLFGTAEDVARIGNAFLGGGAGIWRASTVQAMVRRQGLVQGSSRAVLWDTFEAGGSGGTRLSDQAFGHTGFTGTSVWCDPATDLCMVLLTNRVHPRRDNRKIRAVRREFCDLVVGLLESR